MYFGLATSFVEILKNEWLGIVASAFVLVSFLFSKQTVTRLINICGCIAFVIYGLLLPAYSTAFMNGALIIVHVVFLTKDYLAKRRTQRLAEEQTAEGEQIDEQTNENAEACQQMDKTDEQPRPTESK